MSDSSRRKFLFEQSFFGKIRTAAEKAVEDFRLPDKTDVPLSMESSNSWPLLKISRRAMAGDFEISVNRGEYPHAMEAAMEALDEVERIESLLSVFKPESAVSELNANAEFCSVPVSAELFHLVAFSREVTLETDGAVDITSSPLWKLWGFAKRQGKIPTPDDIDKTLSTVGIRFLGLNPHEQSIRFEKSRMEISFGCIGKGYALDQAAKCLNSHGIDHYLLHGGKSSIIAKGRKRGEPRLSTAGVAEPTGWRIGVANPLHPGRRLAEILLCNEALGTSGAQQQFFIHQGKRYAHIIDPRTGYPADKVLMATVVAPSAALADILSTAFFVLGPEKTESYCIAHPNVSALLVMQGQTPNKIHCVSFGFSEGKITFDQKTA